MNKIKIKRYWIGKEHMIFILVRSKTMRPTFLPQGYHLEISNINWAFTTGSTLNLVQQILISGLTNNFNITSVQENNSLLFLQLQIRNYKNRLHKLILSGYSLITKTIWTTNEHFRSNVRV